MSFDKLFKVRLIEHSKYDYQNAGSFMIHMVQYPIVEPIHGTLSDLLTGFIAKLVNDSLNETVND